MHRSEDHFTSIVSMSKRQYWVKLCGPSCGQDQNVGKAPCLHPNMVLMVTGPAHLPCCI